MVALLIGVLLSLLCIVKWEKDALNFLLHESIEKAGPIIIIIGAGGAFGAILAATNLGHHLSSSLNLASLGLLFPFILTSFLKTVKVLQRLPSSSIVYPLMAELGLNTFCGQILCVLCMGAGSMMISHANDAYFWVISKFSGISADTTLKVYSTATILMGITTFITIYILSLFLL